MFVRFCLICILLRCFVAVVTTQLDLEVLPINPSVGSKDRRWRLLRTIDVPHELFDTHDLDRIDLTCVDVSTHIAFRSLFFCRMDGHSLRQKVRDLYQPKGSRVLQRWRMYLGTRRQVRQRTTLLRLFQGTGIRRQVLRDSLRPTMWRRRGRLCERGCL